MFGNDLNRPVHLEDCRCLFFDRVLHIHQGLIQGGDQLLLLGCFFLLGSETLLDFTFETLEHICDICTVLFVLFILFKVFFE